MNTPASRSITAKTAATPLALPTSEIPGHTGPILSGDWSIDIVAAADKFSGKGLQLFISVAPNAGAEPLDLPDLEIPGRTGPLPSGKWGINIAAAADNFPGRGLQLYIGPWDPMSLGDNLEVLRDTDVVGSLRIQPEQVDQRVVTFIPTARLTNGPTTVSYRVTRLGSSPETSKEMEVYVKLDRPGGKDQNGDIPGHSELHMIIPPEIVQGGVDKDNVKGGVKILIEPYPNIAKDDVIRLSWGGQFVRHAVTAEQATAPEQNPIEITVEEDVILAAGDSGPEGLAVTFEVYDVVENRSEDWSAEIRIVVDTGSSRLAAPMIKEAVNNELNLDVLGSQPVTVQILAVDSNYAVNDQIVVNLKGTAADGTAVDITLPGQPITSVPSIPEVQFPSAQLRSLVQTQAVFSFQLVKADGTTSLISKGRFISVVGDIKRLEAPIAQDALQGALDPGLASTRIEIPWDDSMADGQVIDLKWLGTRPDLSIYFPELPQHPITHGEIEAGNPITMRVQGLHLTPIDGGTLELYYLILSDSSARAVVVRESLHAKLLTVGEPRA